LEELLQQYPISLSNTNIKDEAHRCVGKKMAVVVGMGPMLLGEMQLPLYLRRDYWWPSKKGEVLGDYWSKEKAQ
jgi:hypothetical protein